MLKVARSPTRAATSRSLRVVGAEAEVAERGARAPRSRAAAHHRSPHAWKSVGVVVVSMTAVMARDYSRLDLTLNLVENLFVSGLMSHRASRSTVDDAGLIPATTSPAAERPASPQRESRCAGFDIRSKRRRVDSRGPRGVPDLLEGEHDPVERRRCLRIDAGAAQWRCAIPSHPNRARRTSRPDDSVCPAATALLAIVVRDQSRCHAVPSTPPRANWSPGPDSQRCRRRHERMPRGISRARPTPRRRTAAIGRDQRPRGTVRVRLRRGLVRQVGFASPAGTRRRRSRWAGRGGGLFDRRWQLLPRCTPAPRCRSRRPVWARISPTLNRGSTTPAKRGCPTRSTARGSARSCPAGGTQPPPGRGCRGCAPSRPLQTQNCSQ